MANGRARALRKTMTPQEVKLWAWLRPLRAQGLHFRRQVPFAGFIIDFACLPARLAVELDGSQHGMPEGAMRDHLRDSILSEAGFKVLRFWNHEVDRGIGDVTEAIYRAAIERLPPSGAARHLPRYGEG